MDRLKSLDSIALSSRSLDEQYDDSALEGVAANVKLLLKLVQDHKEACQTHRHDGRRMLRVAGMMTILDMVRTRIQKCQSFGAERTSLRQSNNDMRTYLVENEKRVAELTMVDEKDKLKRQLSASSAARKSLEVMCSSLGKEKEIMMGELARKAHELSEMEDHIEDLKAQNDSLLERVKECAEVHEPGQKEPHGNMAVCEQNKALKDQLMRSLNGYRNLKRNLADVYEENIFMQSRIEEMGIKVGVSLEKIRKYRQNHNENSEELVDIEEGILELEHISKCFDFGDRKNIMKQCGHVKKKINVPKPIRPSERREVP
ncbi:hypothetical protein L2E82_31023 [Cichorium intybus]|uniref:Uncharacterized protein n=1 Tax=Cichorium intybus TaxID=13427 RepID=A0ACB9D287_CICIN|nr:hypothetical protein L2E82_31023 [Cichorium intybus]